MQTARHKYEEFVKTGLVAFRSAFDNTIFVDYANGMLNNRKILQDSNTGK